MTVKELMKELSALPPYAHVLVYDKAAGCAFDIECVLTETGIVQGELIDSITALLIPEEGK